LLGVVCREKIAQKIPTLEPGGSGTRKFNGNTCADAEFFRVPDPLVCKGRGVDVAFCFQAAPPQCLHLAETLKDSVL
jgi:hypothetical protein